MNTVYAPGSVTEDETFLWYRANPRVQIGLANLWKQNAFRFLASVTVSPETNKLPAFNLSAGVQGIGTGNPGYSGTFEKNWELSAGSFNAYVGLGFRSNEDHSHMVGGVRFISKSGIGLGIQDDGHMTNPFVTLYRGNMTFGIYLVDSKRPAYLIGTRF